MYSTPEQEEKTFNMMDRNGDGYVNAAELDVWFEAMQSGMPPPGTGTGGGGDAGAKQPPKAKPAPQAKAKAKATPVPPPEEDDDGELPSHDEL